MSVTAIAQQDYKLASGSRDCSTRVWDLKTQQTITKRQIDRNLPTGIKWICNHTFIQTSEDLHARIFDIRTPAMKPQY